MKNNKSIPKEIFPKDPLKKFIEETDRAITP